MFSKICIALAVAFAASTPSHAQESRANRTDAVKLVKKGVELLKTGGKEKAITEFTAPSTTFIDRDLYLVIYDLEGNCLAHGQNAKQVGKALLGLKDPDGKLFVQERVELAKSKGKFWQDYKFTDPLTKKVLPKQMYCEKEGDAVVCGGVYKEGT